MRVLVAGAGIGGLAAALALAQLGFSVEVAERSTRLGEIGAGIQISPNAMKVLRALDVGGEVLAMASQPEALELRLGRSGMKVFSIPLGQVALDRYDAPYLHLHRADLLEVLRAAAVKAGVKIRLGAEITAYANDAGRVHVGLVDGEIVDIDVLVGADGMRSQVRRAMLGEDYPRFTGAVAWRMTAPATAALGLPASAIVWVGPGKHVVTYRIRRGQLINFVGVIENDDWRDEEWDTHGDKAQLAEAFEGWAAPVEAVIAAGGECRRWALFDRDPLPRWSDGRVTLLGDACHAMAPFLAQGAGMALEDAYVLAHCLREGIADPPSALKRYESMRKPRTTKALMAARANMGVFHRSNMLTQAATYAPMKLADIMLPAFVRSRQDWIYAHDVTQGWRVVS